MWADSSRCGWLSPTAKRAGDSMATYPTRKRILDLEGEGQRNDDGTARQDELGRCAPGERVTLVREPGNPYDANAIRVLSPRGICIGYLGEQDAATIAPALDRGQRCEAHIHELTGGLPNYPSFGCRICITWAGQTPLVPRPVRPEQSLYGRGAPTSAAGCLGTVLLLVFTPTALSLAALVSP